MYVVYKQSFLILEEPSANNIYAPDLCLFVGVCVYECVVEKGETESLCHI